VVRLAKGGVKTKKGGAISKRWCRVVRLALP